MNLTWRELRDGLLYSAAFFVALWIVLSLEGVG